MTHRILSSAILCFALFFCFGCQNEIRPKVDMADCKIQPGHQAIVIDGRTDSKGHEWDGAASVPFPKDGIAKFLWDDKGVYGYLAGKVPPPCGPDESICVSMIFTHSDPDKPTPAAAGLTPELRSYVHLYVTSSFTNKQDDISGRFTGIPAKDLPKAKFAGYTRIGQQILSPWSGEFFIPWQVLSGVDHPQIGALFVHVYRIQGERPYSFLELKLPENNPHP